MIEVKRTPKTRHFLLILISLFQKLKIWEII